MSNTTTLGAYVRDVETVATAGGTLPDDWNTIRQRWADYLDRDTQPTDDLAAAILAGAEPHTIDHLTTAALVARTTNATTTAPLHDDIAGHVLTALRATYQPVAADNYAAVAARFNDAAKRLKTACGKVDPEARAETLLEATQAARAAWAEVPALAAELDGLLPVLTSAATLAGLTKIDPPATLGLITPPPAPEKLRPLWDVYENTPTGNSNTPRGGRWTPLLAVTDIKAPATIDKHTPVRRPRPIESGVFARGAQRRDRVSIEWDPELGETFEGKRAEIINASRIANGKEPISADRMNRVAPKITPML